MGGGGGGDDGQPAACENKAWYGDVKLTDVAANIGGYIPLDLDIIVNGAPGADLNTAANRDILANALADAGINVEQFSNQIKVVLGFHPVPTNVRKYANNQLTPDMSPEGFLGAFLAWGSAQPLALRNALAKVFNPTKRGDIQDDTEEIKKSNCTRSVNVPRFAKEYLQQHKPDDVFAKYLAKAPRPTQGKWELIDIGKYDFDELRRMGTTDIPAKRGVAMNRGFERMARLQYLLVWIHNISTWIRATKPLVADCVRGVEQQPDNPLLTFFQH